MKKNKKILACLMSFLIITTIFAVPMTSVYAAGDYEVKAADTIADIQAQANSGSSLHFSEGTYNYDGTLYIPDGTDISITTDAGAQVTFTPSAGYEGLNVSGNATVTFAGNGTVTVDCANSKTGSSRGINCAGYFNITGGTLNVLNSPGYGIGGDACGEGFNMTGGILNISHCGWSGDEGGFIWSKNDSVCNFTAGELNISDCGNTMFGSFYVQCPVTFGGESGEPAMTVNLANSAASSVENTIYTSTTLTVKPSAVINITLTGDAGMRRGINTDGASVVIDGGTFNVINNYTGSDPTYGIRGAAITVENGGTLDVEGTTNGVAIRTGGTIDVSGNSLVTINTTGDTPYDSYEAVNTITGSSVLMQDEYSIINGKLVNSDDKVWKTPVNASGELLTRFDLANMSNSSIDIAADPDDPSSHPEYMYDIASDHNGTAYVWAPAVKVNFWPNAAVYATQDASKIIQTCYTIRGNNISFAGSSAPDETKLTAPSGTKLLYWINAATGEKFDPETDEVSKDTDVYAAYSAVTDQDIPIDILEDNGDGSTFINGPRNVSVGDKVYYKMTIDMSSVAQVAAYYANSTGYLTGTYTMTVTGNESLKPSENRSTSSDINEYFSGDAVKLFEMVGAPSYDDTTNTLTYKAKVRDEYAKTGINGTELAKLLNSGLYAISKDDNCAVVQDPIKTTGYGRAKITFSGDINFSNQTYTKNFTINMSGVQKDPDTLGDPTLNTYGNDPAETISTTVLYKADIYNVTYNFISGTNGKTLPSEVTALTPAASTAEDNTSVTAAMPSATTVQVPEGVWTFNGYDTDSKTVNGADINFEGTWTFAEKQYNINYKFESGTEGKDLPSEVISQLPPSSKADNGSTVKAIMPSSSVSVSDGKWIFIGYDAESKTISSSDITFTGKWVFTPTNAGNITGNTTGTASTPLTGDGSNILSYTFLLILSAVGCAWILLKRSKRGKHSNW
jgi:hypothetical protein